LGTENGVAYRKETMQRFHQFHLRIIYECDMNVFVSKNKKRDEMRTRHYNDYNVKIKTHENKLWREKLERRKF
jgi:hypothetical protein